MDHPSIRSPGLYKITEISTKRVLIGEGVNVSRRLNSHKSRAKKKIHSNFAFQQDVDKYGLDSFAFEVISFDPIYQSIEKRREEEKRLILEAYPNCYNVHPEQRNKEEKNPFYGLTHTKETREIIGDKNKIALQNKPGKITQIEYQNELFQFCSASAAARFCAKHGFLLGGHKSVIKRIQSQNPKFKNWKYVEERDPSLAYFP